MPRLESLHFVLKEMFTQVRAVLLYFLKVFMSNTCWKSCFKMPRHNLAAATLFTMETTLQVLKKYFTTNSLYLTWIIQLKISLTPFVSVLAYLALYRIDELGIAHFRKFVLSHEANKMHRVSDFSMCWDNLAFSNTENINCFFFFALCTTMPSRNMYSNS